MTDKEILETIFDMRYHHSEYTKRKNLLEFLNIQHNEFNLTDKEKSLVSEYYVEKKKLRDISEEAGLSYGYVRHKMMAVRKKIIEQIKEGEE